MRGVVASSHVQSAAAGAEMLAAGGNAFDAAAAAAFAAAVCEPTLTGLGGGGFATIYDADGSGGRGQGYSESIDFFVSVPGIDIGHAVAPMQEAEVMYGRTPLLFAIGTASAAVPGFVKGVLQMHEQYGVLDRQQIMAPAIRLATEGVAIDGDTEHHYDFLRTILLSHESSRAVFAPSGDVVAAGDVLMQPQLAQTLQLISDQGEAVFYEGVIADKIIEWSRKAGGRITRSDLAKYEASVREPIRDDLLGSYDVLCTPPPSSGGVLTSYAFELWDRMSEGLHFHELEGLDLYLHIMRRASLLRGREFDRLLYTKGLVQKAMGEGALGRGIADVRKMQGHYGNSGSTTQLSVIDERGNAVSMTSSLGVGSGQVVDGTGIYLSNMLGESDLYPVDYQLSEGDRLTSMMNPTLILHNQRPFVATGSAGSTRIRSAIFQTTLRALEALRDQRLGLAEAVEAAVQNWRLHPEGEIVHLEPDAPPQVAEYLQERGHMVQVWDQRNLYFGGVNMAASWRGLFAGAGDNRRGGHAIVVD